MVRYLDTAAISAEISQIFKKADEYVYIVSPYLKICDNYREAIEYNDQRRINTKIVYGKNELQPKELSWINSLKNGSLYYCKDLHAKCYANEQELVITSMNLYEFSQINNDEMGLAVYKKEDPELFDEIMADVRRIVRVSENIEVSVKTVKQDKVADGSGYCIRCKEKIKLDPMRPYCKDDYDTWSKYSDPDYIEKKGYCHICGRPNPSSLNRPVCKECYSKNKDLF